MRTLITVAVFILAGLVAQMVWPQALRDWTGLVVVDDGAMEPVYEPGDVVLVKDRPRYLEGDVVAFRYDDEMTVGRIVGGTSLGYVVQGDNELLPYDVRPTVDAIVGSVAADLPAPLDAAARGLLRMPTHLIAALLGAALVAWSPWQLRRAHADRLRRSPEDDHRSRPSGDRSPDAAPFEEQGPAPARSGRIRWRRARPESSPVTLGDDDRHGVGGDAVEEQPVPSWPADERVPAGDTSTSPTPGPAPVPTPSVPLGADPPRPVPTPEVVRIAPDVTHDGRHVRVPSMRGLLEIARRRGGDVLVQRRDDGTDRWLLPAGDLVYEYAVWSTGGPHRATPAPERTASPGAVPRRVAEPGHAAEHVDGDDVVEVATPDDLADAWLALGDEGELQREPVAADEERISVTDGDLTVVYEGPTSAVEASAIGSNGSNGSTRSR